MGEAAAAYRDIGWIGLGGKAVDGRRVAVTCSPCKTARGRMGLVRVSFPSA